MDRLSRLGPSGKRPLSCCLITIAVALLVLYCLVGEAKATGWYYRFMPVQREEHRRLLLAAGSSEALGGKQAQDDTNPLWLPFSVRRLPWGLVTEGSAQQQIERENQHIAVRPFRAPTADTREADGASATSGSFSLSLLERDVEEFWFEQPLDHGNPLIFNRPSHDEWKQKVFSAKVKSPCRSVDQHAGARRRIPGASPTGSEGSEYGTDRPQGSTDGRGRPTERKPDQFSRTDATPGSRDDTMEAYGHEQGVRPVFIYIGGEGPLSPLEVQAGLLREVGDALGADLYALEHRYYGVSHPRSDSGVENLQWLTSKQALNDLAAFISYIKQKTAAEDGGEDIRPEDVPVVVFGCSYPGSLAAYARAKYPALILGAISSSSPVEASALFTEYDQTVRRVLPLECVENITAATAVVQKRLFSSDEAAARVAAQFGCDADVPTKTLDQRIALLYVIADMTSSAVQYNRPPTRPLIEKACSCFSGREEGDGVSGHINDDQDDDALVESLAKLVKIMFQEMRTTCKDENMLALTDTALGPQPASSARLWLWQSCAEFGFWQVAPPESVRSHLIDLDWHMRMCNALFPLPGGSKFSTDVVRETNVWSGEKTLAGPGASTNIHFTNGANDPWASLSVTNVPSNAVRRQKLSSFVIENGSHCNDFYAYAKGTEPRPVTEAKTRVLHSIRQWLEEFRVSRQRAKTTQEDLTAQEL